MTMLVLLTDPPMLADILGGGEIVLIVAMILIVFGAGKLFAILRRLGEGAAEFWRCSGFVTKALDRLGGIYGKLAAEALTQTIRQPSSTTPPCFTSRSGPVASLLDSSG